MIPFKMVWYSTTVSYSTEPVVGWKTLHQILYTLNINKKEQILKSTGIFKIELLLAFLLEYKIIQLLYKKSVQKNKLEHKIDKFTPPPQKNHARLWDVLVNRLNGFCKEKKKKGKNTVNGQSFTKP